MIHNPIKYLLNETSKDFIVDSIGQMRACTYAKQDIPNELSFYIPNDHNFNIGEMLFSSEDKNLIVKTITNRVDGFSIVDCWICNTFVSLCKEDTIIGEYEQIQSVHKIVYSNIPAYLQHSFAKPSFTGQGTVPNSTFVLCLPVKYVLADGQRVIMKNFNSEGFQDKPYMIQDISLNGTIDKENGIVYCFLLDDMRGEETIQ